MSRRITGIVAIFLGLYLIIMAILNELWILCYGIPIFIIGFFIFFNKKEDDIEEIKGLKNKDNNK